MPGAVAPRVAGWRRRYGGRWVTPSASPGPDERSPLVEMFMGGQWVDVTRISKDEPGVYYEDKITITRGRPDEGATLEASRCSFTLNNRDGRFSPRNPLSPYFGQLGRNTPVRVSVLQNGVRRYRFHGEIAEMPSQWDPSGADVRVPLVAYGVIRRLAQGAPPRKSTMFRGLRSKKVKDLRAYWPCEDKEGSTYIASATGGRPIRLVGQPSYAAFSDFDCSDPIPTIGDSEWNAYVPAYPASSAIQVRFLMAIPSTGAADSQSICKLFTSGSAEMWHLTYKTGGGMELTAYSGPDLDTNIMSGGIVSFGVDGDLVRVSIQLQQNGSNVDWLIAVLQVGASTGFTDSGTLNNRTIQQATQLVINNGSGLGSEVAIGHISVQSTITSIFDFAQELRAYASERSWSRIRRVCDESDVDFAMPDDTRAGISVGSALMGPALSKTALELVREAVDTDHGILYEPRDQLGIGYRVLSNLYRQDPKVQLDYSAAHLVPPLDPTDDDLLIRNDVTATREGGSSARVAVEDGPLSILPPPDGVGTYDYSVTINPQFDERLPNQAAWIAHLGTVDETRYPVININLKRPQVADDLDLTNSLLTVDLGDRLVIDNPPPWLPPEAIDQIVQGYTETITSLEHDIAFNCSPASPYDVALYDVPIGSLTAQGASATPDYIVDFESLSTDVAIGKRGVIYDSGGTIRFNGTVFTITRKGSFVGFTNNFFSPDASGVTNTGDVFKELVEEGCRYQTGGSELAAPATADATTLSVATTVGPVWTQAAAEMPLDIMVGGERMVVTSVSSSSSPQTFTVTRSFNGISKSHTAGTDVRLFKPAVRTL